MDKSNTDTVKNVKNESTTVDDRIKNKILYKSYPVISYPEDYSGILLMFGMKHKQRLSLEQWNTKN